MSSTASMSNKPYRRRKSRKVRYQIGYKTYPSVLHMMKQGTINRKTGNYDKTQMTDLNKNSSNIPIIVVPRVNVQQNSWSDVFNNIRKYLENADENMALVVLDSKHFAKKLRSQTSNDTIDIFEDRYKYLMNAGLKADNTDTNLNVPSSRSVFNDHHIDVDVKVF